MQDWDKSCTMLIPELDFFFLFSFKYTAHFLDPNINHALFCAFETKSVKFLFCNRLKSLSEKSNGLFSKWKYCEFHSFLDCMSEITIRSYRIHIMQFNDLTIIDGFFKRNGSFCQTNFFQKNITFTVLVSWKIDKFRTNIIFFSRSGSEELFKVCFMSKNSAVQQL